MKYTEEIIRKHFSHSFMGYDMEEVDFFLDELIDRFEALEAERKELLSAMEYLLERVEEYGSPKEQDKRRLAAAENTFRRLNATPAQSVASGPVRVTKARRNERKPAEKQIIQSETEPQKAMRPELEEKDTFEDSANEFVEKESETVLSAPDTAEFVPSLMDEMESVLMKQNETEQSEERKGGMLP